MGTTRDARRVFQADVVILGGGLIGLACASALARVGLRTLIVSSREPGAASPASAGILAPSVGHASESVRTLGIAARDMYPEYLQSLALRTGIHVPLDRSGVLEVAFTEEEAVALRASIAGESKWLDGSTLRESEPGLGTAVGGCFHPDDGAIDVGALLHALSVEVERDPRISIIEGRALEIRTEKEPMVVELEESRRVRADHIVVAAGAWVNAIRGLPRTLPVVPLRGQMLALEGPGGRHTLMGTRGYIVQRGNRLLIGSTMENAGFDARTTPEGAAILRNAAIELLPSLQDRPIVAHWAGLRPVTPDLCPLVGPDPDRGRLVYACGHSKNGVLLAPLTGALIAESITRGSPSIDITPYAPGRFAKTDR